MSRILIITGRYLPGFRDGGPVRTIKNLVDNLGRDYEFVVMCADRDHGDLKPYGGIKVNELNQMDKASVFYCKNGRFRASYIKKLSDKSSVVYVCGPYNSYAIKTLILKRAGLIKTPLVLAPMGSFSKGALSIGSKKKKLFFKLCKIFGLYKNIYFSVTSEVEKRELRDALGIDNKCYIAEDMPGNIPAAIAKANDRFSDDSLRIIFLSRICEKKNLSYAIDILSHVTEKITFDFYGIIEDKSYYEKCVEKLKNLPNNIKWEYKGELNSESVPGTFSRYDIFLFPTKGENYGHVISEALASGCIPVISDTTPWLDLDEKCCGYVIPLDKREVFTKTITCICKMTKNDKLKLSENAVDYFKRKRDEALNKSGYMEMFDELLRQNN